MNLWTTWDTVATAFKRNHIWWTSELTTLYSTLFDTWFAIDLILLATIPDLFFFNFFFFKLYYYSTFLHGFPLEMMCACIASVDKS